MVGWAIASTLGAILLAALLWRANRERRALAACCDEHVRRLNTDIERVRADSQILRVQLERASNDADQTRSSEERLRRFAERNDAILRTSMDGFFVIGEDYKFVEVNQAFAGMLGYSVAELLEMKITDLEAEEPYRARESSFARTGLHQFPTAHRHKDGHIVHLEISVTVLHDDGRKIVVGFARDVTDRRRAEEAMLELTRQNKSILDSAGEGICGVDIEGVVRFANPAAARMLDQTPGGIIGRRISDVMLGLTPSAQASECPVFAALRNNQPLHLSETEFVRAGGATFPVEYTATPIHENGRVTGAVIVFNEITPRKRAEEERRRLEAQVQNAQKLESLGLLAGGIAHDFNNILVGILGNACLAMEELPASSEVRPRIQRIVNAGQRASKVIHQILAYAGQARPDADPLDLNSLAEESIDFLRATVPAQVSLEFDGQAGLPPVCVDSGQIEQLLSNLMINAVEAIGSQSGRVTVRTLAVTIDAESALRNFAGQDIVPGRYAALEVEDNGSGMSPETLARIFEPFYSNKAAGRGLGLAAIQGIVRAHSGGIAVRSTLGKGTCFQVLLPIADVERVTAVASRAPQNVSAGESLRTSATVLVIDDEDDIRDIVRFALEGRGMTVLDAAGGEEGVAIFRERAAEIDLVLLDMTMPRMDGRAVMREILSIDPDARVVLSSGYSETDVLSRLNGEGLAGFVHKPYTTSSLVASIEKVLRTAAPHAAAASLSSHSG